MKKFLCLILVFCMAVSLSGCFLFLPTRILLEHDNDLPETQEQVSEAYKSWALGCSAIWASRNPVGEPYVFGTLSRTKKNAEDMRYTLSRDWNIRSRDDLIDTIERMTYKGHSARFAEVYALVSENDFDPNDSDIYDSDELYMWQLTETIGDKWNDKQILAWDWFRMIHLATWGYVAGYIELEESYDLMTPVIELLRENFSSWDEACENYLDGYAWWSRTDVSVPGTEYQRRLSVYEDIRDDELLFDPSVWEPEWSID